MLSLFKFVRAIEEIIKQRDPEQRHDGASLTCRHLRSNLVMMHQRYGVDVRLPEPSGTDVNKMNVALRALQDLGDGLLERALEAESKDEGMQRCAWLVRSNAGHIRGALYDLGWTELGSPRFRRIECPADQSQSPARVSDAGAVTVANGGAA